MKLYLDDDSASGLLAQFLRQAGHDVRLPVEIGMDGENDAVHLTKAVLETRVLLFEPLALRGLREAARAGRFVLDQGFGNAMVSPVKVGCLPACRRLVERALRGHP